MAFTKVYSVDKEVAEIFLDCARDLAKRLKEHEIKQDRRSKGEQQAQQLDGPEVGRPRTWTHSKGGKE